MKISGKIYLITNVVTGGRYIGQTTKTLEQRLAEHRRRSKTANYPISNAIKKYGIDNFTITLVEEVFGDSKESVIERLNQLEVEYIVKYETLVDKDKNGYNATAGGQNSPLSEQSKKKISDANKGKFTGENNPFYKGKHSQKTIDKIISVNLGNLHNLGRIQSKLTKEKISKSRTGIYHTDNSKRKISETMKNSDYRGVKHHLHGKVKPVSDEKRSAIEDCYRNVGYKASFRLAKTIGVGSGVCKRIINELKAGSTPSLVKA